MKYKMICIDMDGTLLNSTKRISKRNLEAIKKAHELGVKVVVTTGRLFSNAAYYSNLIGVDTPVIAANGAVVRDKNTDEIIYESPLSYENCEKILGLMKKHNIIGHFHTPDTILSNSILSYIVGKRTVGKRCHPNYKVNIIKVRGKKRWLDLLRKYDGEIAKCILFSFNFNKIQRFREDVNLISGVTCFGSGRKSLEINAANVSKGNAVKNLGEYLGINQEEIICIGDNENDISMIEYAGLGVSMGNGIEMLKQKADYITSTNDEDGVAKVIEKFILT